MPDRPSSSAISTTRPRSVTWWYQSSLPRTVSDTCGSRRMFSSRLRVAAMFTSTRPSSHRYQVAAECGSPSGVTVAMADGFGSARNA